MEKYKKSKIEVEEYTPEFIITPEYKSDIPWFSKEKLDASRSVRSSSSWVWTFVKTLNFTLSSIWTWTHEFTWFWFTPTSYTINAWWTGWSQSMWAYDGTTETALYSNSYAGYATGVAGRVIHLRDSGTLKTYWVHEEFSSDWVVIRFQNFDINCTVTITAYK